MATFPKRSNPSHSSSAKVHSSAFSSVVFFLVGGCDVFFSKYQTIQSKKIHTFKLSSWWFVNLFLVGWLNHPFEKYATVKMGSFPQFSGWKKKTPPPSFRRSFYFPLIFLLAKVPFLLKKLQGFKIEIPKEGILEQVSNGEFFFQIGLFGVWKNTQKYVPPKW